MLINMSAFGFNYKIMPVSYCIVESRTTVKTNLYGEMSWKIIPTMNTFHHIDLASGNNSVFSFFIIK